MSTPDAGDPAGTPRSFLVPGLALLAVVVVLAAAAFVVSGRFRPAAGIDQTVVASPSASSQPATGPSASVVAAGPAVSASAAAPAVAVPSGVKVATSPLEQEIETAYLHYWDVRAAGLLNLDATHYPDVMAGAELQRNQQQVADFKQKGQAVKIEITHQIAFGNLAPDQAQLVDEYTNTSYALNPATQQPIGTPGPGGVAKVSYQLKKLEGAWKVVDGTRLT